MKLLWQRDSNFEKKESNVNATPQPVWSDVGIKSSRIFFQMLSKKYSEKVVIKKYFLQIA